MICFLRYDSFRLNMSGFPLVTDIYVSGNLEDTSGYISIDLSSDRPQDSAPAYSYLHPFTHGYDQGPFAYNSGTIEYFYNNRDVYLEYITIQYNTAVDRLTAGYSEQNQKSWNKKSELAFAYNAMSAGAKSGCLTDPNFNMLVQEAAQRYLTLDDLIMTKILPKAMYFENAHGILTGKWSYYTSGVLGFVGSESDLAAYLSGLSIDFSF